MSSSLFLNNKKLNKKANKALEYLKRNILLGNYSGGQHISEPEIAKIVGVSRPPVRAAIRELENQGIVKTIPRRGSFVVEFTEDDIKEIYDIRIMLEGKILKILIEKRLLNTNDFEQLEKYAEQMLKIANKNDISNENIIEFMEFDIEFHQLLWEKSERRLSYKMLANNYIQLQLAMIQDYKEEANLTQTAMNHFKIIEKLKEGDEKGCRKSLVDHIVVYNKKLEDICN